MRKPALIIALIALSATLAAVALLLAPSPARTAGLLLACDAVAALASLLLILLIFTTWPTTHALSPPLEEAGARPSKISVERKSDTLEATIRIETSESRQDALVDEEQLSKTSIATDAIKSEEAAIEGAAGAKMTEQGAGETSNPSASTEGDPTRDREDVQEETYHPEILPLDDNANSDAGRKFSPPQVEGVTDSLRYQEWLNLVEECVELLDDLERHKPDFDLPRLELAEHVTSRLTELLERSGVEVISEETRFDRLRHQPEGSAAARAKAGTLITETLSPGFAIGRRVLRRAKVRL